MADQFAVTFDGHLYELPGSCPLLLAQDVSADPSFTLLLNSDSQNFLLMGMNNSTINIQQNGQVCVNAGDRIITINEERGVRSFPAVHLEDKVDSAGFNMSAKIKENLCLLGEGQLQQHCNTHVSRWQRSGCRNQIEHCAGVQSEWSVSVM